MIHFGIVEDPNLRWKCGDEDEKVTEGGTVRSTISTKRSRAAAIHNQSEKKRRDKINQKMRTLQKLVPNSSKTDKASMLDEVIDYLKQLQAQVTMMSRMGTLGGMPSMMMPMGMQQFQMAMMAQMAQMAQMTQMAQMGIGMGGPQMAQMGLGMMDMSALNRAGPPTGTSPVLPASPFMPMIGPSAWDPSVDCMQQTAGDVTPDPFSAFVACPTQKRLSKKKGTLRRPKVPVRAYVLMLFNEDLKPGPTSERHFGLFNADGSAAYKMGFTGLSSEANCKVVQSLGILGGCLFVLLLALM